MAKRDKEKELVVVMAVEKCMPEEIDGAEDMSSDIVDSVAYWSSEGRDRHTMDLLYEAQRCWDNMESFRRKRETAKRFVYDNQYCEKIVVDGVEMTEEEYIRSQGKEPMSNNLERRLINNVVGTYINQDKEPTCSTRDKAEQVYGQTMSTLLQYCRGLNKLDTKMGRAMEEWLWSGMVAAKVTFGWGKNGNGKKLDCWVDLVDMNTFFVDSDAKDVDSFSMMGQIHELSLQEICAAFVSGMSDEEIKRKIAWIKDEYSYCSNRSYLNANWNRFGRHELKEYDFLMPSNTGKCRVIEIWNKESRKILRCWDKGLGKVFTCKAEERMALVDNVNRRRIEEARKAGMFGVMEMGPADVSAGTGQAGTGQRPAGDAAGTMAGGERPAADAAGTGAGGAMPAGNAAGTGTAMTVEEWAKRIGLVEVMEGGIEEYWYVRFVTPTGRVLMESECPYLHGMPPYVVCCGAFIDGEVHSFESTFHDQQKYVNRLISMQQWITQASAKGVLLAPEGAFDGQDIDEVADAWARFDGVITYKPKAGVPLPQQISANSVNIGIPELLATELKMFEDVSGVNGALQGKSGYSATSGVLYAQQIQNGTTSLMSCMMYFAQFNRDVAYMMVKLMCQYYDSQRVLDIVGDEAADLDPEKALNIEYDLNMVESTTTPAYRQVANQFLAQLRQWGDLTGEEMLEAGDFPFGDKALQLIQARNQKMAQMQGGDAAGAMAGGEGPAADAAGTGEGRPADVSAGTGQGAGGLTAGGY